MLFKIGMAIVISLIAAIITMIAGLLSGVRTGIVMLRAVLIFAVSGFGLTFGLFWLEKYGIPLYIAKKKDEQSEWLKLYLSLKAMEDQTEQAADETAVGEEVEEQPLVDVSVSDEMSLGALTEEELASLSEDTGIVSEDNEVNDDEIANLAENTELNVETAQEPYEETVHVAEPQESETVEFAPLSADSMTHMKVPAEESGL